jgi:predicted transcriptional regulator
VSHDTELTFCGVCVRLRDGMAHLEVRGQFEDGSTRDVSQSSYGLFPPHGQVELRSDPAAPVARGDWFAFRAEPFGPPTNIKFRAVDSSRLLPFEDMANVADVGAVRRLLIDEGRIIDFPGPRYVRIGEREMVLVDMRQGADGRWRVDPEADLWKLPVWEFKPALCLIVCDGAKEISVIDPRAGLRQIGTVMWSSDADLLRKLIAAMRDKSHEEDDVRSKFTDAVLQLAAQLESRAETSGAGIDFFLAQRVQRLREVAATLRGHPDVLQEYFDFLRQDPEVKALIEQKMAAAVETEIARQRAAIRETLTQELDREIENERARRKAELEKSIGELETDSMNELDRRLADRSAEVDRKVAEHEAQGLDELGRTLGAKRSALEADLSSLADRDSALEAEIAEQEKTKHILHAELRDLDEQQQRAIATVERWTSIASAASALGNGPASSAGFRTSVPAPDRAGDPAPRQLRPEEFRAAVADCHLLTDAGKDALVQIAASMLAGEVPLLHGQECDDFIEIVQSFVAGGRHFRLEADPTIISFDDLWIRPGTQVATPLRQAVDDATGTQLCVISKADLSGARFWYPPLADRARRSELPTHLLFCATLKDPKSEEAMEIIKTGLSFEATGLIAPKASVAAPLVLTGPTAEIFELHIENRSFDLAPAVGVLGTIAARLGICDAERIARIFAASRLLMRSDEADKFARDVAFRLAAAPVSERADTNVISLGGSSRA